MRINFNFKPFGSRLRFSVGKSENKRWSVRYTLNANVYDNRKVHESRKDTLRGRFKIVWHFIPQSFQIILPQNVQHIFFGLFFLVISTGCCYIENRLNSIFCAFSQIFLKFPKKTNFHFCNLKLFYQNIFSWKKQFLKILKYPKKGIFYFKKVRFEYADQENELYFITRVHIRYQI